jgi:O-antigen ligase
MQNLERIAKILIIAAIASLFFRRGVFHPYIIRPFEILILLASIVTFILIFSKKGMPIGAKEKTIKWTKFWGLFFLFITFGLLYSYSFYDNTLAKDVKNGLIIDYFTLLTNALAFLLIIYYSKDIKFIKNSQRAFLVLLLFSVFLVFQKLISVFNITEGIAFTGFHTSRTAIGSLLSISFATIASFFVKEKNICKKIIFWLGTTFMLSLILWTGSRAAYLAVIIIIGFIVFNSLIDSKRKLKIFLISLLLVIISVVTAYIILPTTAKNAVIFRIFPQFAYQKNVAIPNITLIREVIKEDFRPQIPSIDRHTFWPIALKLFITNPFGLSTQFPNISKAIIIGDHLGGSHNTFLQVGLSGGWPAFILFIFFVFQIIKSLKKSFDESPEWLALAAANSGLFIILLVDDRLFNPWVWIIGALAISYQSSRVNDRAFLYASATPSQEKKSLAL